jgi:uncharacterized protein
VSCLALAVLLGLLGLLLPRSALALEVPPLQGRVVDLANVLSPQMKRQLEAQLEGYESGTGHQLAVLTVPSLEGEPLEDYTIRVVENWKLGKKGKDDGVLLFIAVAERRIRIEVGYGLEGDVPDVLVSRIIREVMVPAIRQNDLGFGITRAVSAITAATGGQGVVLPPPRRTRGHDPARHRRGPLPRRWARDGGVHHWFGARGFGPRRVRRRWLAG